MKVVFKSGRDRIVYSRGKFVPQYRGWFLWNKYVIKYTHDAGGVQWKHFEAFKTVAKCHDFIYDKCRLPEAAK